MKEIAIFIITIYQKTLSPDHGVFKHKYPHGFCRYYPSCSEYGKLAIQKHGVIKGLIYALNRVIKCNPWAEPGIDKVS